MLLVGENKQNIQDKVKRSLKQVKQLHKHFMIYIRVNHDLIIADICSLNTHVAN